MAEHTPGPWTVKPTLRPDLDDDPMGEYVVEPVALNLTRRYFDAEPETPELAAVHAENAANARLMASAPELLEALRAAVERMEAVASGIPVENRAKGVSQATHVRHMAGHLAQHAKIARAAIRKATGEG